MARAGGLLGLETHEVVGLRDAGFLVEDSELRHQVQRVLQLRWRGLVGLGGTFGVALQIDVDFADRLDVTCRPDRR